MTTKVSTLHMITTLFLFLASFTVALPARPNALVRRGYDPADPSLPPAVRTICPNGLNGTTVDEITSFGPEGTNITVITGKCLPSNNTTTATTTNSGGQGRRGLEARQRCPSAPNDCVRRFGTQFQNSGFVQKCGAPCTSSCYPGGDGPDPNHCEYTIQNLIVEAPQMFVLKATEFKLFLHETCGIGIENRITLPGNLCSRSMVYDYQDIAHVARYLAWNCQAAQGARGGRCTGATGVYDPRTPDFYVQVYRN